MEPAPASATGFAAERTLLQQELIRLRAQRDRQIDQLTRANHLSDTLARTHDEEPLAALFAEAVLDVLDVAVGAAWIIDDPDVASHEFAVVGVRSPDAWADEGRRIADALRDAGARTAVAADRLGVTLPEADLADVLVSPILNRGGTCAGILLAAGSARAGGMSEPIAEETRSMLSVLAEKLAAHLDGRDDRRLIREQMARLRDSEAHVRHLAFYDALTDLPNRRLLADRVQQAQLADQRRGTRSALILLDLDRFKLVNDLYGHAAGDQLLGAVAARLRAVVRAHDTVARLSGDEFVVLLEEVGADVGEAERNGAMIATKILDALREPFGMDAGMVPRGASLGIVVMDDPTLSVDDLIERADVAMYEAKGAGRNRWCLFRAEMQARVNERVALELRLQ